MKKKRRKIKGEEHLDLAAKFGVGPHLKMLLIGKYSNHIITYKLYFFPVTALLTHSWRSHGDPRDDHLRDAL